MNGMLNERIHELKNSFHALWERMRKPDDESVNSDDTMDTDYDRNYEDDMPLTLAREDGPGIRYYATENNPLARGAEKVEAAGIDSFGESDTVDPDDEVSLRDRRNSDLSQRFYTP